MTIQETVGTAGPTPSMATQLPNGFVPAAGVSLPCFCAMTGRALNPCYPYVTPAPHPSQAPDLCQNFTPEGTPILYINGPEDTTPVVETNKTINDINQDKIDIEMIE